MHKLAILRTLGFHSILFIFLHICDGQSTVTMKVTVNVNFVTLSCFVKDRDIRKNIYLHCPLVADQLTCRENCMKQCPEDNCQLDRLIDCRDRGLDTEENVYQIDYAIDALKTVNRGKWWCQYGGQSSNIVDVNPSALGATVTNSTVDTTIISNPSTVPSMSSNKKDFPAVSAVPAISTMKTSLFTTEDMTLYIRYDKLLTRTEFIIVIMGFLVASVVFNLFFCCRLAFVHCRFKKKAMEIPMKHVNNVSYNHVNSELSDSERIYEETPIDFQHIPFTSNVHTNGTCVTPTYVLPRICCSTKRPPAASNPSISFGNSLSSHGSKQMHRPFLSDYVHRNHFPDKFPKDPTDFSNHRSVYPDISEEDSSNISPSINKSFRNKTGNSTLPRENHSFNHCINPPLQSTATIHRDNSPLSSLPAVPRFNNQSPDDIGKTNYQLSREMMEEADNLLRSADLLLRSTNLSIDDN